MKTATIQSVCECQAVLGAELDANRLVMRGWARDRGRGREDRAPAHSIGASAHRFDVAWACPFCVRNVLRSFDGSALVWRE
jgi:hypothetical protein